MITQLLTIIKKDFTLLVRTKSSTLALLFGPLLVILLVGLVFTNVGEPELVVGVVTTDVTHAELYVESLEDAFVVIHHETAASCVEQVQRGALVSCVVFAESNPPKAIIHVDPSDINVVYAVIDRITGQLENRTSMLRAGFATQILDEMTKTAFIIRKDHEQLREAQLLLSQQEEKIRTLAQELRGIRLNVEVVTRSEVAGAIDNSVNARDDYRVLAEQVLADFDDLATAENHTESLEAIHRYYDRYDLLVSGDPGGDDRVFARLLTLVQDLQREVERSQENAEAYSSQAAQIRNSLSLASSDVQAVVQSLDITRDSLSRLDVTKTDLTTPIVPSIEPVIADDDSFGFVFPYFLTLIIMFTSILLASTVIVRERLSSAYFRNFTTPTPEWMFVVSTYITTLAVLAVQLIIIFLASLFFTSIGGLLPVLRSIPVLFVTVTFFALLGMLIGYVFRSQEGIMLASITISSILLFVSNLVLAVDTIPGALQFIINANPLVLASEVIKAILLFQFGLRDVLPSMAVLILYCVVIFAAIMIVQRLARIRFFEVSGTRETISKFITKEDVPEGKHLEIGEWVVSSKEELVQALKMISDDEYEDYAAPRKNVIAAWVLDVYKDEQLARRLRNKSRKGAIAVLERERE